MTLIDKVLNQVVANVVVESKKRKMQFDVFFHLLTMGKPITDYGNMIFFVWIQEDQDFSCVPLVGFFSLE